MPVRTEIGVVGVSVRYPSSEAFLVAHPPDREPLSPFPRSVHISDVLRRGRYTRKREKEAFSFIAGSALESAIGQSDTYIPTTYVRSVEKNLNERKQVGGIRE